MISLDVVTPDVVSYNPAISCCGKGLQWQMALYFFSLMGLNSVTPDVITYSAAISSCEKVSNWQAALHLFNEVRMKTYASPDVVAFNVAAISSCGQGFRWQLALCLFQEARKQLVLTIISYNALITAFEKVAEWQLALIVLDLMLNRCCQTSSRGSGNCASFMGCRSDQFL